jgi:hypothetical protein
MKQIRWNSSELQMLAQRARKLLETGMYSELQAIRMAQLELLPADRHRTLTNKKQAHNVLTEMHFQSFMTAPARKLRSTALPKIDEMRNWDEVIESIAKLLTQQFKDKLYDALIVELAKEAKRA